MEEFLPENPKNIIYRKEPPINWKHFKRIMLILIFFTYFNQITSQTFDFIKFGYKFLILLIILQVFFKGYPLVENIKNLVNKSSEIVKKLV